MKKFAVSVASLFAALSLTGMVHAQDVDAVPPQDDPATAARHAEMDAKINGDIAGMPSIDDAKAVHTMLEVFNLAVAPQLEADASAQEKLKAALSADDNAKWSEYTDVAEGAMLAGNVDPRAIVALEVEANEYLAKAVANCHCVDMNKLKSEIYDQKNNAHVTDSTVGLDRLKAMGATNLTAILAP